MSRRSSPRTPPRPRGHALAVTVAALVALAGALAPSPVAAAPVAAQADDGTTTTTTTPPDPSTDDEPVDEEDLPPLLPLTEIAPELAEVELSSPTYDPLAEERDELTAQRDAAVELATRKAEEIRENVARETALTEEIATARAGAERWEATEDRLDEAVRAVAVDSYIRGSAPEGGPLLALDAAAHDREATAAVTSGSLALRQIAELEDAQRRARGHRNDEQLATEARDGVREAMAEARLARDEARSQSERLGVRLLDLQTELEAEGRLAEVVGTDFPLVVLDAYWKAARLTRFTAPDCGIEWWALAGIGKIESRHGTYAGSEVRADGTLTKPIIGIPLTGANGTAAIGDSDGGLIDGDPTVDRAAGPMQFIPQTWMAYGVDGDQSGEVDIQNIYDAAASAARYLCAAAGSMTDVGGLQRGYFAYNHSTAYVSSVLTQAVEYGEAVEIEGVTPPPAAPPPPPPPPADEPIVDVPATVPPPGVPPPTDTVPPTAPVETTPPPTDPIATAPPATSSSGG